jgi:pimeloyl-ACP methyl ester carboxylesterase
VDRRSNGLEDLRGMNAAEQARDPSLAQGYYFGGQELDGARFGGLKPKGELGFMSEWGLQVHLEDLRAILGLVPAELREKHLFLGGHSLGASVVQAYAAYEFEDGHKGHDDIAGLIVIDGTVGSSGLSPTEEEFLGGFNGGFMGQVQGLDQLRDGGAVVSGLPLVSPDVFLSVEVVAMRASKHTGNPQGFTPDPKVDAFFQLALQARPKGTHEAVLGFAFDQQFQPFAFLNTNMGNANGGRLTPYSSFFDPSVELLRPDDPQVRYGWTPFDGVDPAEVTDLQDVALAMYAGPSNFVEWYFPARLPLDLALLDGLTPISPEDWRWGYGVRTSAASEVDAPVLAIGGQKGLTPSEASFESWRATLAPMTRDGHTRDEEAGYKVIIAPGHAHLDVVMSSNAVEGGNGILDPLLDWMSAIHQGQTLPTPQVP